MGNEAKEQQVLQLLKDYRAWHTAFGGAAPLDDTHVKDTAYGPNGMIFAGQEFEPQDRKALQESFEKLELALNVLREHDFKAWMSLMEPYLGDPADHGLVVDWRAKIAALDVENARRKKAKRQPKVALVWTRTLLERHDRAVKKLAAYLDKHDLVHIPPRLMSEDEEAQTEKQNAEIYAVFQRLRVSGLTQRAAVAQAAEHFRVSEGMIERVVEFRSEIKTAICIDEEGCDQAAYQQGLCIKHYNRAYRARKRRAS